MGRLVLLDSLFFEDLSTVLNHSPELDVEAGGEVFVVQAEDRQEVIH